MSPERAKAAWETYLRTVKHNPWFKTDVIHLRQQQFLVNDQLEVLYGGAAGGGKTIALLMAALQHVDVPGYSALLLRRTFRDLNQPGALIPRSKEWLSGTEATWNSLDKRWTFPSGATLTFGYLDHEDDVFQYQGAEFQFIGFDELTQFTEEQYRYLFSRLRRAVGIEAPLRMRAASNPGGIGHDWVKQRFIKSTDPERTFVPAKLEDNPSINPTEYEESLMRLDPTTRKQLRDGDWDAIAANLFNKAWFRHGYINAGVFVLDGRNIVMSTCRYFMTVDLAVSLKSTADWTVMCVWADDRKGTLILVDMLRAHMEAPDIPPAMGRLRKRWNAWMIAVESNGFQLAVVQDARRQGLPVKAINVDKDKVSRSLAAQLRMEAGQVWFISSMPGLEDFEGELIQFPLGAHDDMVDCLSAACIEMTNLYEHQRTSRPGIAAPGQGMAMIEG